ncbi:MAG: ArsR/SmtB family transcription factor [Promethearchaeota archaeon]
MSSISGSIPPRTFQILQDETRLAIIICLQIYHQLTVKQLSDFLHKGKTTITHHLRKLDEAGIVGWREREEDRKKYKTRYYFISDDNLKRGVGITKKISEFHDKDSIFRIMKTEAAITYNLMEWMIDFTEKQEADLKSLKERGNSFIRTFILTPETLPIYQEGMQKIAEMIELENKKSQDSPVTHISSHVFVQIKDILEWKQKLKKE